MMTFLGPTVTDFGNKFETTVDHVSKVFTVITACYCVGALICEFWRSSLYTVSIKMELNENLEFLFQLASFLISLIAK